MRLWLHKSTSDWALLDSLWPQIFQTVRRCSVLKSGPSCKDFIWFHEFLLFYNLISCLVHPGAIFSAFSPDADEMSTCVSLTALLCDTITTLGPRRGSINSLWDDTGKDVKDFGGLWNEAAMDPQRFTCRKKKNVGTCSFG